jgi:hypothetical protein
MTIVLYADGPPNNAQERQAPRRRRARTVCPTMGRKIDDATNDDMRHVLRPGRGKKY